MKNLKHVGIEILELDVTERNSVERVKNQIEKTTGGTLDILINNAYVSLLCGNSALAQSMCL